jgi:hypothetical protein
MCSISRMEGEKARETGCRQSKNLRRMSINPGPFSSAPVYRSVHDFVVPRLTSRPRLTLHGYHTDQAANGGFEAVAWILSRTEIDDDVTVTLALKIDNGLTPQFISLMFLGPR